MSANKAHSRTSAMPLSHQLRTARGQHVLRGHPRKRLQDGEVFMLDTLAVAWAGSDAPGCREAHAVVTKADARTAPRGRTAGSCRASAAFINGMTSSALDYDSLNRDAPVHVNIAVLPAALAIAERDSASGRDFLTALVARRPTSRAGWAPLRSTPPRGFHYTGAFGVFGAAAAAARLLGPRCAADPSRARPRVPAGVRHAAGQHRAVAQQAPAVVVRRALRRRRGAARAARHHLARERPSKASSASTRCTRTATRAARRALGTRFDSERLDQEISELRLQPHLDRRHARLVARARSEARRRRVDRAHDLALHGSHRRPRTTRAAIRRSRRSSASATPSRACWCGASSASPRSRPMPRTTRRSTHIPKVSLKIDPELKGSRGPVVIRMRTRNHGELIAQDRICSRRRRGAAYPERSEEKFDECFRLGVRPLTAGQVDTLDVPRAHDQEAPTMCSMLFRRYPRMRSTAVIAAVLLAQATRRRRRTGLARQTHTHARGRAAGRHLGHPRAPGRREAHRRRGDNRSFPTRVPAPTATSPWK